jgi:uncharacterized protein YraI
MHTKFLVSAAAGALLAMTGAAFAQSAVVATTDLNVRAGPGGQHEVIGVIGAGQSAELNGCLESGRWCVIAFNGGEGWVFSDYLTGDFGGTQVVVTRRPADSGVRIVEAPTIIDRRATSSVATVVDPPERVRTYIRTNAVEPIYLDDDLVVGADLPGTVTLRDIPDYEYRYVYVNDRPVLVEPTSRRIVYVAR